MPIWVGLLLPLLTAVMALGAVVELRHRAWSFAAMLIAMTAWGAWGCALAELRVRRLRK